MPTTTTGPVSLFDPNGGVSISSVTGLDTTFITLSLDRPGTTGVLASNNNSSSVGDLLLMRAPISGVAFEEAVDFDINRSLGADWSLCVFGMRPMEITLDGVDILGTQVNCATNNSLDVQAFFSAYNLYSNPDARFTLGFNLARQSEVTQSAASGLVFTAVLTKLLRSKTGDPAFPLAGKYKLTLLGVQSL